MNDIFDVFGAVSETAAAFFEKTGFVPAFCFVSREIYRLLVESNAAQHAIGNLIIASYAVVSIDVKSAHLRVVIDESLSGQELNVA